MSSHRRIIVDGPWRAPFIDWLSARLNNGRNWHTSDARTIAHVIDDGGPAREQNVLCVVLLNNWTDTSCEGSIASDGTRRWFSRQFAHTVYDYVFNHAGRSRINFTVSPDNTAAVRMHTKLGHTLDGRLTDELGEGQDLLVYGLTKRQWQAGRWFQPNSSSLNK